MHIEGHPGIGGTSLHVSAMDVTLPTKSRSMARDQQVQSFGLSALTLQVVLSYPSAL